MKRFNYTILLTLLMSMVGVNSLAYDIALQNADGTTIYYYWINNKTELSVSTIGENHYSGKIVIPESVTYKGNSYSVTSIDYHAFHGCTGLTSITIPNSVTSIGKEAFACCYGLTSITIPNSVTWIGNSAFKGCTGLSDVKIEDGDSLLYIENSTHPDYTLFDSCPITSLYLGRDLDGYDTPFWNKKSLKDVTIGNNVTSISDHYGFKGCTGLTSVTIPNSVTWIGDGAFSGCTGLTSITIPNSVTWIGDGAFYGCTGLTSVTIPNSVTDIGNAAFQGCTDLTSITIPNSVTWIGNYAFFKTAWYNNQPDGLVYAGNVAYKYKGTMPSNSHITIKEGTTSITPNAFYNCTGLTSITIPNSVTSIGGYAFFGCTGLTSIAIPNSVTWIPEYAFSFCTGLTSIEIPNSVISIGDRAFYVCTGLTSITIPNSVGSISQFAFDSCPSVTRLISYAVTPPICSSSALDAVNKQNCILSVPEESVSMYKQAYEWKEFFFIEPIPAGIQDISLDNQKNATIYDLNGRKMKEPHKGLNIINGKKVWVK